MIVAWHNDTVNGNDNDMNITTPVEFATEYPPGFYNLDWERYCALAPPATSGALSGFMNCSRLMAGFKSQKALKLAIESQLDDSTDTMRFGSGYHCLLLEPDEFESRFCVMPAYELSDDNVTGAGSASNSKATAWYKARRAEFEADNAGREILTRQQYDQALSMIEALQSHKTAKMWLDSCEKEVTVIGELEGVPMKARLDLLGSAIADLKGCASCLPRSFGETAARLRYVERMAVYRELVQQYYETNYVHKGRGLGPKKDCYFITVENTGSEPDVAVVEIPDIVLDQALDRVRGLLRDYKQSLETGVWPGVDRGEDYIQLYVPNWAMPEDGLDWGE